MPLARIQVRNVYGLGAPELYKEAGKEDPKAVLDGVAVAGLVGILRQLGDLAEFAAEVFHDLQEQVVTIASRSNKMTIRVQHIEAALPPIEKAVTAQTSHIHFAYTAGSDWHAHIRPKKNHLIRSDLPQFIMDSYEECRDPPRLHLLDKFDTGGPGSCLKRYSDPSFFKRIVANSDLESTEKFQKEKKARKSKKRESRRRNEVLQGASICNHSGRTRFASQNIHDQGSAAQTISRFDIELNSSLGDRSTSFDSSNRSGYIECVFDAHSTMQPEEQEHNGLSTSRLKMLYSDTLGSVDSIEQNQVEDGHLQQKLQEQNAPSSSNVTWDEKTEIVKLAGQEGSGIVDVHSEVPELLSPRSELDKVERQAVSLGNIDQTDISGNDESSVESFSGGDQFDEIESETDKYMDALTTMESETETDLECQMKWEVEINTSSSKDKGMEGGAGMMLEKTAQCSDSSDIESCTASYSFSDTEISNDFTKSVTSESLAQGQPHEVSDMSNPEGSPDTDLCEGAIRDVSTIQSIIGDPSSSGSKIPNLLEPSSDKIISSLCKSQESPAEISDAPSIKFWTNGGLLGLEPSKPPACSVSNVESRDPMPGRKYDACDLSTGPVPPKVDGIIGKVDVLVKTPECIEKKPSSIWEIENSTDFSPDELIRRTANMGLTSDHSECSTLSHDNQNDGTSIGNLRQNSCRFSPDVLGAKLEKYDNSHHNNSFDNHGHNLEVTSVKTPGAVLLGVPDAQTPFPEASQENIKSSSSMFGLGHKLIANDFHKKASIVHDDKSEPVCPLKTGVMKSEESLCGEQNGQKRVSRQTSLEPNSKHHFECGSPANSYSSSPPLGHMKISFHPINGIETSMLKLKFPDEHHRHDDIRDFIFPSFQLLPEPALQPHDVGSDSDDDTFGRSSPCVSEDLLSHQSDSNYEQWESDRTPGSKDQELYDGLRRVSSTKSISSSIDFEEINNIHIDCDIRGPDTEKDVEPFHSGPFLDIPSFEALIPISKQDRKIDSYPKDLPCSELQYTNEPTPPPPPLPPLQWRTMKPHFSEAEEKQLSVSEVLDHLKNMQLPESTICQQPKQAPSKQPHTESIAFPLKSNQDQKFNKQKEANLAANSKDMDEREDLLHQIRNKSFNLRRTVAARPTLTPDPTTNIKVTAILEKANAIRQAFVGSDDGGDDETWSDG